MKILIKHNDSQKGGELKRLNAYGGCGYYRVIKVAEQLKKEHDVTVWGTEWADKFEELGKDEEKFYSWIAQEFDVVWIHFIDNPRVFAWLKVACDKYGTKIVMDIDDNFLDVPSSNPAHKVIKKGEGKRAELTTILSFCDALTVSTVPLKEKLYTHFKEVTGVEKKVFVIPNYNDIKDWNFKPVEKGDGIVIGYIGGLSHHGDLKMIWSALQEVLTKYPNVSLQIIGQYTHKEGIKMVKKWAQDLRNRVLLVQPSATFLDYPLWISQMPWNIGIAPLVDDKFNNCKSHIKWMEYSMYEIPVIASNVYPYSKDVLGTKTIEDGVTGILANQDEWVDKLSMLIENKELREKIGKQAKEYIKNNWQYDQHKRILEVAEEISSL